MTPLGVSFTGLDLDPAELGERIHYGVIPPDWHRFRFQSQATLRQVNRWLSDNITGRWACYRAFVNGKAEITIAFELDYDGSMFVLSDGATQCVADLPD